MSERRQRFGEADLWHDGQYLTPTSPQTQRVNTLPGREVCDFCGTDDELSTLFDCRDVVTLTVPIVGGVEHQESIGGWVACEQCAFYVRRRDVKRLAERAARHALEIDPELGRIPRARVRRAFAHVQRAFWENRTGSERPWTDILERRQHSDRRRR